MTDFIQKVNFKGGIARFTGSGSPEGVVVAYVGNKYLDTDNGDLYEKASGDNTSTGWTLINGTQGSIAFPDLYLTTSAPAYSVANINDWVQITGSEYTDIQNDVGTETIGTLNANMQGGGLANFSSGLTYTFAKNELPSTNNSAAIWAFSFYVGSAAIAGTNKVKARVGTSLIDLGNLPSVATTNSLVYFIKKGGSNALATPYLSATLSASNASMHYSVPGTTGYFGAGDLSTITGMTNAWNWGIQALVRTF